MIFLKDILTFIGLNHGDASLLALYFVVLGIISKSKENIILHQCTA